MRTDSVGQAECRKWHLPLTRLIDFVSGCFLVASWEGHSLDKWPTLVAGR